MPKKKTPDPFYEQMMSNRPKGVTLRNTIKMGGGTSGLPASYFSAYTYRNKRYVAEFVSTEDGPQWQVHELTYSALEKLMAGWGVI